MPAPYRPLNAKTFKEGRLHLRCQFVTAVLAILSGGLAVVYEMMLRNVEDRDFRDMLFDYRVTQAGRRNHHTYFIMGALCTTSAATVQSYNALAPYCPPTIELQCAAGNGYSCDQAAARLYAAAGLAPDGSYQNCYTAGRVSVSNFSVQGATVSTVYINSDQTYTLQATSATELQPELEAIVAAATKQYADQWYRAPRQPLDEALMVDGTQLFLSGDFKVGRRKGVKRFGGWDPGLWPFKIRCPNTDYPDSYAFSGSTDIQFAAYSPNTWQVSSLQFLNSSQWVNQYNVTSTSDGRVSIARLSTMQVQVAMVPSGDACNSWQIDSVKATYSTVWMGSAAAAASAVGASTQTVQVTMVDVAAPKALALPAYAGNLYIYLAIVFGGFWLFSVAPVPLQLFVIYVNVRRNNGLPPPFYRYMRGYRGWGR